MVEAALLLIGFSVFYVVVFVLTHFKNEYYQQQIIARFFGVLLMLCLALLQIIHFLYLFNQSTLINSQFYLMLLYMIAPSFYFYARPLLKADDEFKILHALHFLPVLLVKFFAFDLAFTLAFVVGSAYLAWLLKTIYALRTHKDQFKYEIILLVVVFSIAIAISVIAVFKPFPARAFYSLYASAIGLALFIVALVVSYKPQLSESISQAAHETYAVSTLSAINCDDILARLQTLMQQDKLYRQNNLDRFTLATELNLSVHQLSELMNSLLGVSFSTYLRQQRINEAKVLLKDRKKISVLNIALQVGFSSQSNFYDAFKEIVGITPSKYRNS